MNRFWNWFFSKDERIRWLIMLLLIAIPGTVAGLIDGDRYLFVAYLFVGAVCSAPILICLGYRWQNRDLGRLLEKERLKEDQ